VEEGGQVDELVSRDTMQAQRTSCGWTSRSRPADREARLSRLAAWVLQADKLGQDYGLRLPGQQIRPAAARPTSAAAWRRWRCAEPAPACRLPRDGRDTLFLLAVIGWVLLPHVGQPALVCSAFVAPCWCGAPRWH
jgi:hypothetical protein